MTHPASKSDSSVWVLDGNWFRIYSVMATRSGWDFDFFSASYPVGVANYFIRWNFCVDQYLFLVSFLISLFPFFFPFLFEGGGGGGGEVQKWRQAGRRTHGLGNSLFSRTIYFEIFIPFYDEIYHGGDARYAFEKYFLTYS